MENIHHLADQSMNGRIYSVVKRLSLVWITGLTKFIAL